MHSFGLLLVFRGFSAEAEMQALYLLVLAIVCSAVVQASYVQHPRTTSGITILEPAELAGMNIPISYAQFSKLPDFFTGLEGFLSLADPILACQPLKNAQVAKDTIVLIDRGDCEFYTKATHLEKAGTHTYMRCVNEYLSMNLLNSICILTTQVPSASSLRT